MTVIKVEEIHTQLIGFYPVYSERGSQTRLICAGAKIHDQSDAYDHRQVESVKRALARCYAVDLQAQAQLLRTRYDRQIMLHFFLPDGRVFVPFKLRKRRVRGDAAYGYLALDGIDRLVAGDPPQLTLHQGNQLPLCSSIGTARQAYYFGLEIQADFLSPPPDDDRDLLNALKVLRGLLNLPPPVALAGASLIDSPRRHLNTPTN